MIAISWNDGIEETAERLMEVSSKAKENGEQYAFRRPIMPNTTPGSGTPGHAAGHRAGVFKIDLPPHFLRFWPSRPACPLRDTGNVPAAFPNAF